MTPFNSRTFIVFFCLAFFSASSFASNSAPRKSNDYGGSSSNNILINANELLPANKRYYHYRGFLTIPLYSEGVRWFVMQNHTQVSQSQVHKFNSIVGNNRPIQPHKKFY